MASNLLELRRAAGFRNANDFAEAHGIPSSTYARYESNPDKIPMERAWQLADILGTTIDAIVGRETPDPAGARGEVQLEYDGLTPEGRALADELREFVLMKDERIRARKRREEAFESADAARSAFESFLQEQAARKRGRFSTKLQELNDNATIKKIMAAYDRTHGEYDFEGMHVLWSTVDLGAALEYDSSASRRDGGAKA